MPRGLHDRKERLPRTPPRPSFTELDRITLRDIGTMVSVELDRDTDDFAHLVGKKIVINGRMEHCFSIERLSHGAPWKRGERIHLLIRKTKAKRKNHAGSIGLGGELTAPWTDPGPAVSDPPTPPAKAEGVRELQGEGFWSMRLVTFAR
jgi:hypothetical protein